MSLMHTLLGVLNWHPMTGYELKKHLDNSTQFFWHAELSQIYPVLKQLELQGFVTAESLPQEGKPDKKVYAITPAGRAALVAWLSEPMDGVPPMKNPVLLKLFFAGILEKQDLHSQLRMQLEAQRARLKRIQQEGTLRVQEGIQVAGRNQESLMWELVRHYGELQAQMTIQWLEAAIEAVKDQESASVHEPKRHPSSEPDEISE
jgi:DNA-binding PadR family transcriptional regulator